MTETVIAKLLSGDAILFHIYFPRFAHPSKYSIFNQNEFDQLFSLNSHYIYTTDYYFRFTAHTNQPRPSNSPPFLSISLYQSNLGSVHGAPFLLESLFSLLLAVFLSSNSFLPIRILRFTAEVILVDKISRIRNCKDIPFHRI